MSSSRNIDILRHIIRYCNQIQEAQARFGDTIESLQADEIYKSGVSMFILQIGELTSHLSDDFKAAYSEIPWQDIKGMRNIAAHHYGKFDIDILYVTIKNRIPELRAYCEKTIHQHEVLEQQVVEEPEED